MEARKKKQTDPPLKLPEEMWLCQYLDFRLLTSRTVRENACAILRHLCFLLSFLLLHFSNIFVYYLSN